MIKKTFFLSTLFLFGYTQAMQNLGGARKGIPLDIGMEKALEESRDLLPEGRKTRGYHNEGFAGSDRLCCVPEPEPELYADERLHLQDAQPLDKALADIIGGEHLKLYSIAECMSTNMVLLEQQSDENTILLIAKAVATKVDRPYTVLPASLLGYFDFRRFIDAINEREQPCTVILHGLNSEASIRYIKCFIERNHPREFSLEMPKVHFIITTRCQLSDRYNNTMFENIKPLSCQGRMRLLRYHLEQLPVQPDETCSEDYLKTIAQRTSGFSASRLEDFVGDVLLHALGAQDAEGNLQERPLARDDFETVLKDSYGIGWMQGVWSKLYTRLLEAKS